MQSDPVMWIPSMDVFLSHWFTDYAEARRFGEQEGGYLFPYAHQFFVASTEAVRSLCLDPRDPDFARIGYDWVRPADSAAWERLRLRRAIAA
jgi:hypothetical protein